MAVNSCKPQPCTQAPPSFLGPGYEASKPSKELHQVVIQLSQFLLIKIFGPRYKKQDQDSYKGLQKLWVKILGLSYKRQQLNSRLWLTIVADQCQHRVSATLSPTAQLNTNGRRSLRVYRKKNTHDKYNCHQPNNQIKAALSRKYQRFVQASLRQLQGYLLPPETASNTQKSEVVSLFRP